MQIFQIIGLALTAAVLAVLLRRYSPELALLVVLCGSGILFLFVSVNVSAVFSEFNAIVTRAGIDREALGTVLKVVGIAYLGQFAAALCKDAGESALAGNIEFCAKIIIMVLSMPVVTSLFRLLADIAS